MISLNLQRYRRCARALVYLLAAALLATLPVNAADDEPASSSAGQSAAAVPAFRQANHIAVLTIDGPIDRLTYHSLERRHELAMRRGAEAIVIRINTPGGALDATLDICTMIKSDFPANTVAWVNRTAYSAGTIIALACREIVIHPNGTFGDAAPVIGVPFVGMVPIPTTERAKIESPLLAEVVDSARRNYYDEKLVQAFVSAGVELWMLENTNTGERIFVDRPEFKAIFGTEPPDDLTRTIPPHSGDDVPPVRPAMSRMFFPDDGAEDAEPADPQQIARDIEDAQTRPSRRPDLAQVQPGTWQPLGQVTNDQRLLTVKADEAKQYGLVVRTIADDEELAAFFGASSTDSIRYYDESWSEVMARILSTWWVQVLLIAVFLIGAFLEMSTPGVGVFGASAFVALLLLVGVPALAGMANWWAVLLIILGIVLVVIEILLLPGLGVAGVGGAICLFAGLVGIFIGDSLDSPQGYANVWTGIAGTLTSIFAASIGVWLFSRHVETSSVFRRLILTTELPASASNPDSTTTNQPPASPSEPDLAIGDEGEATTDLHPSGKAMIDGRMVDVQSAGGYIPRGTAIRVSSVGRYTTFVEEID